MAVIDCADVVVGEGDVRVLGTEDFFFDVERLGVVFQRPFLIALILVNRPDVVVASGGDGVVAAIDPLVDADGLEIVLDG